MWVSGSKPSGSKDDVADGTPSDKRLVQGFTQPRRQPRNQLHGFGYHEYDESPNECFGDEFSHAFLLLPTTTLS
jgi:hypothetical protein